MKGYDHWRTTDPADAERDPDDCTGCRGLCKYPEEPVCPNLAAEREPPDALFDDDPNDEDAEVDW